MTDGAVAVASTHSAAGGDTVSGKPGLTGLLGRFLLDLLVIVLVYVVVIAIVVVVGEVAAGSDAWLFAPGNDAAMALFLIATTLVATALVYALRAGASRSEIGRANAALRRRETWWLAALVLAGMYLLSYAVFEFADTREMDLLPANEAGLEAMVEASPLLAYCFIVLVAPICEEILFRRVLFRRFMDAGRPVLGYVLTGALFASSHEGTWLSTGEWGETMLLWLDYFAVGAGLAWLYKRTGSLWAPILVHMANNAIWTTYMIFA